MNILYIAKFPQVVDEEAIAQSLEKLGHKVIRVAEQGKSNERYLQIAKKENIDIMLCAKLEVSGNARELIEMFRYQGIKTISWTFDLYIGYKRENLVNHNAFFKTDYVFTSDGGHQKEFKKYGIKHYILRQGIADEMNYMTKAVKYKHDVVFVGGDSNQPYRPEMLAFIKNNFSLKWYGKYDTWEVRKHELNKLYASAKIVLGDSVYSPYYWSNRIYEVLGRGGFLIHPITEGICDEFKPYKHFIPYSFGDFKGLKKIIDYYLVHDEKRNKIRRAGFEHCKKYHTTTHRVKKLCKLAQ